MSLADTPMIRKRCDGGGATTGCLCPRLARARLGVDPPSAGPRPRAWRPGRPEVANRQYSLRRSWSWKAKDLAEHLPIAGRRRPHQFASSSCSARMPTWMIRRSRQAIQSAEAFADEQAGVMHAPAEQTARAHAA